MRLVEPGSPKDSRRLPKLGVFFLFLASLFIAVSTAGFSGPSSFSEILFGAFVGLLVLTGIGLIMSATWARWIAGALFLTILVLQLWSVRTFVSDILPHMGGGVDRLLWVLNSVLTSGLFLWLVVRALITLHRPERPASPWTGRLVGLLAVAVGSLHIKAAFAVLSMVTGMSMSVSGDGIKLVGFRGWPLFHVALVLAGLALLVGKKHARVAKVGAAGLVMLASLLCPLVIWSSFDLASKMGGFGLALLLYFLGMAAMLVYLCWWLLHELEGSWGTLRTRDFKVGLGISLALMVVVGLIGGAKLRSLGSFEDRFAASEDEMEAVIKEIQKAREDKYQAASGLNRGVLPKPAVWTCEEGGDERCETSQQACDSLNGSICHPADSVWCFSYGQAPNYRCYSDEGACRWEQEDFAGASRCEEVVGE